MDHCEVVRLDWGALEDAAYGGSQDCMLPLLPLPLPPNKHLQPAQFLKGLHIQEPAPQAISILQQTFCFILIFLFFFFKNEGCLSCLKVIKTKRTFPDVVAAFHGGTSHVLPAGGIYLAQDQCGWIIAPFPSLTARAWPGHYRPGPSFLNNVYFALLTWEIKNDGSLLANAAGTLK